MTALAASDQRPKPGELAVAFAAVRSHRGLVVMLLAAAGVAWYSTAARMAGMDAGPGTDPGALGWFAGVWTVMMAAMMLPSLAPTAALCASVTRSREPSRCLLFASGYLLVWSAAGIVAYGLFELGRSLSAGGLSWHSGGRWLAASMLALAATYQLTALKHACLLACRSPLRLLRGASAGGLGGALASGVRAGGYGKRQPATTTNRNSPGW